MTTRVPGQFTGASLFRAGRHAGMALALCTLFSACTGQVGSAGPGPGDNRGPGDDPEGNGDGGNGGGGSSLDPAEAGDPPPNVEEVCDRDHAMASAPRIWRLTAEQYENTLNALVPGGATGVSNPFAGAESGLRFKNFAAVFGMPEAAADILVRASGQFAPVWMKRLATKHTCAATLNADCASKLVTDAGSQAFRRPLTGIEVTEYTQLVAARLPIDGPALAAQAALEAMLISPSFVFRSELGAGAPDAHGRVKLTPYEMASAISYTLVDGPPDAALMTAAAGGGLETAEQVRAQVVRLLGNLDSNPIAPRFLAEYFTYHEADGVFKDPVRAPYHDAEALMASTDEWMKDVLASGTPFIETLLTSNVGFVNGATAETYGVTASGDAFSRITLPADQRGGILTQPSFLVTYSAAETTDPILRGKFIARSLLCSSLPDVAPPQVPPLPDLGPDATMREKLSVHREAEPQCRVCHDLMDPLGLGLEAYDDTGRYRTEEKGRPVDATGRVVGSADQDGPFDGGIELGQRLAQSVTVEQCFVRHTFRFWMGRDELDGDACAVADAFAEYKRGDGNLRDVIASILTSDAFLYRTQGQ